MTKTIRLLLKNIHYLKKKKQYTILTRTAYCFNKIAREQKAIL